MYAWKYFIIDKYVNNTIEKEIENPKYYNKSINKVLMKSLS